MESDGKTGPRGGESPVTDGSPAMQARLVSRKGTWREVADCANVTVHRGQGTREPPSAWKRRMLLCEHSPIRELVFDFQWIGLKYWVSVHFVRHKVGIEHFVRTQREDRTGIERDGLPQGSPVEHRISVNAQAMIQISRRRLCRGASPETREAWAAVLECIRTSEPELFSVCVPDCIYRGRCYEMKSCGYAGTEAYARCLAEYRDGAGA